MHLFGFLLLSVIWGSNFILMKKASMAFGPLSVSGGRVLGGAIVLGFLWRLRGRMRWPFERGDGFSVAFLVIVGFIWPYTVLPWLIGRHGESGFFSMVVALVPLLTIVASIPMLNKYPTWRQVIGVVGGLGFIVLLFRDGFQARQIPVLSLLLGATVPVCYATANTWVKRQFKKQSSVELACTSLALSSLFLVPLGFGTEPIKYQHDEFGFSVLALVWFALIGTGVSTWLFYRLLIDRGPLWAGMTAYLVPVVGLLWGWIDGEEITTTQLLAFAGILTMVALVQFERQRAVLEEPIIEVTREPAAD